MNRVSVHLQKLRIHGDDDGAHAHQNRPQRWAQEDPVAVEDALPPEVWAKALYPAAKRRFTNILD